MRKKIHSKFFALVLAVVMVVCSCIPQMSARAVDPPKLAGCTPQQILKNYGLTATGNIYINTHCHSNFLVKVLNNNANSGLNATDKYEPYNKKEEFYFETFGEMNNSQLSNREDTGQLYIGPGVTKVSEFSNGVNIKNASGKTATINKPGPSRITFNANYVNMDDLAQLMASYNKAIKDMPVTTGTTISLNTQSERDRWIKVGGNGQHVANVDADALVAGKTRIIFTDITEADTTTSVVLNIDMQGKTSLTMKDLILAYGTYDNALNNSENSAVSNHNRIYYNFYDSTNAAGNYQYTGSITFDGRGFGTIIAPAATITLAQNWDGVVVAKNITVAAQFHRIASAVNPPSPVLGGAAPVEKTAEGVFSKQSTDAAGELAGAELTLTIHSQSENLENVVSTHGPAIDLLSADKKTITWTSGTDPITLSGLPEGEYQWSETKVPVGSNYRLSPDIWFMVGVDGKIYPYIGNDDYSTTAVTTMTMVDAIQAQGIFSKQTVWGKELPGAELTLTVADPAADLSGVKKVSGSDITATADKITWTSGEVPTVIGSLPDGEYTWEEISAPAGFIKSEKIYFKIDNGAISIWNDATSAYDISVGDKEKIVMKDDSVTGSATFSKVASVGGELPGAELSLTIFSDDYDLSKVTKDAGPTFTYSNNNNTITWISTSQSMILRGLPIGIYEWKEVSAPAGYEIADTVRFKVGTDGTIYKYNSETNDYTTPLAAGEKLTMIDEAMADPVGKLTVVVHDEKTGDVVPGAKVKITYPDGTTKEATTDTDGKIVLDNLTPGKYVSETVEVPDGYTITTGKTYETDVPAGGDIVCDVYITTDDSEETPPGETPPGENPPGETPPATGSLTVIVYDEKTGDVVPGATVKITAPDGTAKEYVTDTAGKVSLTGLIPGQYKTETTKVPDGYTVSTGQTYTSEVVAGSETVCKVYIVTTSSQTTTVKTGDNTPIVPIVCVMVVALAGAVVFYIKKRKA